MVSWTGVCYNSRIYKDPMKFDPLRFDGNKYNDSFLWPMFSGGPRFYTIFNYLEIVLDKICHFWKSN